MPSESTRRRAGQAGAAGVVCPGAEASQVAMAWAEAASSDTYSKFTASSRSAERMVM